MQVKIKDRTSENLFRELFNKAVKTIYIDPSIVKTIESPDEKAISLRESPFCVDMSFYLILSQYFKKTKIKFAGETLDLRISFFMIRPSRMGKGQIIKAIEEAGRNLGLKVKRVSYLNQASLIGTINELALQHNMKRNLDKTKRGFIDPVIKGDLANFDILIFPEAKKLIKGSNEGDTEFILSTFQEALDCPGLINKKMKYDIQIEYESTVSIMGTTYYVAEISELLLVQGFFQRIIIDKEEYGLETVKNLRTSIIDKFSVKATKSNFKVEMQLFTDALKLLKREEKDLQVTEGAIEILHRFNKQFFEDISITSGKQLEIMKSFSQTMIQFCVKIGGINCCLREGDNILDHDLSPAIELFKKFTKTLLTQIIIDEGKKSKLDELKMRVIQIYKKYVLENITQPTKDQLALKLKQNGFSTHKARDIINSMIIENYFIILIRERNKKIIKLNENV